MEGQVYLRASRMSGSGALEPQSEAWETGHRDSVTVVTVLQETILIHAAYFHYQGSFALRIRKF